MRYFQIASYGEKPGTYSLLTYNELDEAVKAFNTLVDNHKTNPIVTIHLTICYPDISFNFATYFKKTYINEISSRIKEDLLKRELDKL